MLYESIQLDKKFIKFRSLLGVGEATAIGHLACMWMSCWRQASEVIGDAFDVELAAAWTGEAGKLFSALRDGGWIDQDENGLWSVHDFWDYAPRHVKLRRDRMDERSKPKPKKKTPKPKATDEQQTAHTVRTPDVQSEHNNGVLVLGLGVGGVEETPPPENEKPKTEKWDQWTGNPRNDPRFLAFFQAFGNHIGEKKAADKYQVAVAVHGPEFLERKAREYSAKFNGTKHERQFMLSPATWLEDERWNDRIDPPEPEYERKPSAAEVVAANFGYKAPSQREIDEQFRARQALKASSA